MLQITVDDILSDQSALAAWREEFSRCHVVYIENFIEPSLLRKIQTQLADSEFSFNVDDGDGESDRVISQEARLNPRSKAARMLWLLLNRHDLFTHIHNITGCDPIGCFLGRGFRFDPSPEHFDNWHDDLADDRLIGLSIDLGEAPCEGGEFELRERESEKILARVENKPPGSVHLFRIDERLQHRVGSVRGKHARVACAGWFCRRPVFREAFLNAPS